MIFVTVGAQMPFDRLVRTVDAWVGQSGGVEAFAQIAVGGCRPRAMPWVEMLDPTTFRRYVAAAELIISHAGMGSILTAQEYAKPLLVMPRRAHLQETRSDHQVATAHWLLGRGGAAVAFDEVELAASLDKLERPAAGDKISPYASPQLLSALRRFLNGEIEVLQTASDGLLSSRHRG